MVKAAPPLLFAFLIFTSPAAADVSSNGKMLAADGMTFVWIASDW